MALLTIKKSDTKLTILLQGKEPKLPEKIASVIAYLFSNKGIAKNKIEICASWWGIEKPTRIVALVEVDGKRWTGKDSERARVSIPVEMLKKFVKDSM